MKHKTLLFLFFAALLHSNVRAQSIVTTDGNFAQNATTEINWTLGELCTETFTCENKALTQGFNQVYFSITAISDLELTNYSAKIFPNPTSESLNVELSEILAEKVDVQLFDVNGKLLQKQSIQTNTTQLNVSALPAGTYILQIKNKQNNNLK